MNPILLKPTDSVGSQVIVNGEVIGNMKAREYFEYKTKLIPDIKKAFHKLESMADVIVIEGAGSPAEINLKDNDIVNMGMAEIVDAPVLLVADIDRGGVFAQLLGTVMLLEDSERDRIKGLIINKFRGDKTILDPGITMIEERSGISVTGVLPYMDVRLEDEDSLSDRFDNKTRGVIDIAVVRFPRISNFTDFNVFEQIDGVSIRYVTKPDELEGADMVILPGSKNTIGDLKWMREKGIESMVKKNSENVPVFGICGGYQMLGNTISDPNSIECGGSINGLGLLDIDTLLRKEKTRTQKRGCINSLDGIFSSLSGLEYEGYEIHVGETTVSSDKKDDVVISAGNAYGTYIHGIFDQKVITSAIVDALAKKKNVSIDKNAIMDYSSYKEQEYDRMADILREHLNMGEIYAMLREAKIE
jgi:adenosylcobyric acid synthase